MLNVSSVYRVENACDLLAAASENLQNLTDGFRVDCSTYTDAETTNICNRFNSDDSASRLLGAAIQNATAAQAQQCASCTQALARPNGSAGVAMTSSSPLGSAHGLLPVGKSKAGGNTRNLLQTQPTCSGTGLCFQACETCQRYGFLCAPRTNSAANTAIKYTGCSVGALAVGTLVRVVAGPAICVAGGSLCPFPTQAICVPACLGFVAGVSGILTGAACSGVPAVLCENLNGECDACDNGTGLCDPSTTQCCAGETGRACGEDCCCCPLCQAPGGPNCECQPAAC